MKTFLSLSFFFMIFILNAQTRELVINDLETADTLVIKRLVEYGCADVSNFQISPNSNNNIRSFSYSGDVAKFPFKKGVIISTGKAASIPILSNQKASSVMLDDDSGYSANQNLSNSEVNAKILKLRSLINPSFSDAQVFNSVRNTAFLSFDFIPVVETFSFRFLFASEEYEDFACSENFSDVFAFFLEKIDTGENTNLAQIRDSETGELIPIKVSNIRPNIFAPLFGIGCDAKNADKYVSSLENNVIGFNGRTIVLTASSSGLSIGEKYNITLIITDRSDSQHDSAVFIEGGSFNITSDIGEDRTIENGNPVLSGETLTIDPKSSITPATYSWYKNGTLIEGVIDTEIDVNESGLYQVIINSTLSGGTSCRLDLQKEVDFVAAPNLSSNTGNLIQCASSTGEITYNLDEIKSTIRVIDTDPYPPYTYTYHRTEEYARIKVNGISTPTNYTPSSGEDAIYIRVENRFSFYSIARINLQRSDASIENPFTNKDPSLIYSDDDSQIILKNCNNDEEPIFDLTTTISYLKSRVSGIPEENIEVTFYENLLDATLERNTITGANNYRTRFINSEGEQIITVRLEDTRDNSCISFLENRLVLKEIFVPPVSQNITPLVKCGNRDQNFDLTEKQNEILSSVSGTNYRIDYFYLEETGNSVFIFQPITNPTSYQSDFQNGTVDRIPIYFNLVGDVDTKCTGSIYSFEIMLDNPKVPSDPLRIESCFATLDTSYNLTALESQILSGQSGITIRYYDENGTQIATPGNFQGFIGSDRLLKEEYTVSVQLEDSTGCTSNTSITLIAEFVPDLQAPSPIEECEQDNNSMDEFDLTYRETQILNTLNSNLFSFKYYESLENAQNDTDYIQNPERYISRETPYEVFVKITPNYNNCPVIFPITLNVRQVNRTRFQEEYVLCLRNDDSYYQTPPVISAGLSTDDYTFEWYLSNAISSNTLTPVSSGETYTPDSAGTVSLKATNKSTGCRIWDTTEIKVYYIAENFSVKSLGDIFSQSNDIEIVSQDKGTYLYSIDGINFQESPIFRGLKSGDYTAYIRSQGNCRDDLEISFIIIDYPRFFTPNGDGINDVWRIENLNEILQTPEYTIQIFNREGQLLKVLNEQSSSWDGTINNFSMPIGDYWFKIFYTTSEGMKIFQSHFTLTR